MSNSEPSAIVLQGIPCMGGLYKFSIRMEKDGSLMVAAIHPFQIAHEVSNWLDIALRRLKSARTLKRAPHATN
jgi:hypothetical protein